MISILNHTKPYKATTFWEGHRPRYQWLLNILHELSTGIAHRAGGATGAGIGTQPAGPMAPPAGDADNEVIEPLTIWLIIYGYYMVNLWVLYGYYIYMADQLR